MVTHCQKENVCNHSKYSHRQYYVYLTQPGNLSLQLTWLHVSPPSDLNCSTKDYTKILEKYFVIHFPQSFWCKRQLMECALVLVSDRVFPLLEELVGLCRNKLSVAMLPRAPHPVEKLVIEVYELNSYFQHLRNHIFYNWCCKSASLVTAAWSIITFW